VVARSLLDVSDDVGVLDGGGRWAVAVGFEGRTVLARFAEWAGEEPPVGEWDPVTGPWASSLDESEYIEGVHRIKQHIAGGWVYQVNLCRVLGAECRMRGLAGLYDRLTVMGGRFAGSLELPDQGVHIACASPERFLSRAGSALASSPIKGTAERPDGFLAKDRAENVMIVDLVRNDLGRVAEVGTVCVPELLVVEPYPGLYHLQSTVVADVGTSPWRSILTATFPPGSVTGAPKSSALEVIGEVEPVAREWYCGAFGWVDADAGRAELAVTIRTFWLDGATLKFGTGAGITWGSDPVGEWWETQLKAQRLIAIAGGAGVGG
jgi:para-aminobenzoate synthetase component 1